MRLAELLPELNSLTSKISEIKKQTTFLDNNNTHQKLGDQFNQLFRTAFDQGLIMQDDSNYDGGESSNYTKQDIDIVD